MTDSTGTAPDQPGSERPTDTAAALPLDTGVLIVPRALPTDELDSRHLLVLPDDVETEEVEASTDTEVAERHKEISEDFDAILDRALRAPHGR